MTRVVFSFSQKQFYEAVCNLAKTGKLEYVAPEKGDVPEHVEQISVEDLQKYADYKVKQLEDRKANAKKREKPEDVLQARVLDAVTDDVFETAEQIAERVDGTDIKDGVTVAKVRSRLTKLTEAGMIEKKQISDTITDKDGKRKTRKLMAYKRVVAE